MSRGLIISGEDLEERQINYDLYLEGKIAWQGSQFRKIVVEYRSAFLHETHYN